jgi:hypothetical protein
MAVILFVSPVEEECFAVLDALYISYPAGEASLPWHELLI